MTYAELLLKLTELTPEQLRQDVTIFDPSNDEFYGNVELSINEYEDILDVGHPFLHIFDE